VAATGNDTHHFFDALGARGFEPGLSTVSGTLRFDAVHDAGVERWYVTVDKGSVKVSHKNAKADATVRGERGLLDRLVTGNANATAAILRGALIPEGDLTLLQRFQRVFPGPPRPQGVSSAGYARRMR
jgi:hypothetical protein